MQISPQRRSNEMRTAGPGGWHAVPRTSDEDWHRTRTPLGLADEVRHAREPVLFHVKQHWLSMLLGPSKQLRNAGALDPQVP